MHPVILSVSLCLIAVGILGTIFDRRVDRWMKKSGDRVFPRGFRRAFESGFGDPAENRTARKVALGFLLIGIIGLYFGPVVS